MATNRTGTQTLGFAAWSENLELPRKLIDAGAFVDDYGSVTEDNMTPLMESVDELQAFFGTERVAVTDLLLSAGVDVGRRDRLGRTPLHMRSARVPSP